MQTASECFCRLIDGHLVSLHSENDYKALVTATRLSCVASAVWVGAHETAEGQWTATDGTTMSKSVLAQHGHFDNWGGQVR